MRARTKAEFSEAERKAAELSLESRRERERELLRLRVADEVSALAENLGVSRKQLADRIDMKESNLSRSLSGDHNLTLDTISDLCFGLGTRFSSHLEPMIRDGLPSELDPPLPEWVCQLEAGEEERFAPHASLITECIVLYGTPLAIASTWKPSDSGPCVSDWVANETELSAGQAIQHAF